MSEYKRLVSYLYLYENGVKLKNTGYAKIDIRDGKCRMDIRIRGIAEPSGMPKKAYIFLRDGEGPAGVDLGTMAPGGGGYQLKAVTDEADLMGSGVSFDSCGGIIITCGKSMAYATEWDDKPVNPVNLHDYVKDSEEKPAELVSAREDEAEAKAPDTENAGDEPEPEKEETVEAIQESAAESEQVTAQAADMDTFEEMKSSHEGLRAFADDEIGDCFRITPQDLVSLPKKEWILGNNSFLLHGFYNYHYLLMGRKRTGEKDVMILGVPGTYYEQEKMMAGMFGFPLFKPAEGGEPVQGTFGYWYREMDED